MMRVHQGMRSIANAPDERPKVTWALLRRVFTYAQPYRLHIAGMLVLILATTGLTLLTPLILRDLIDNAIPAGDLNRLLWLALALLAIPAANGIMNVVQRRVNSSVGEGVIYDLRKALYSHLQRMSLRFFTNTKVGELMSRLNNDVVGAQNAISNTIVGIVTNIIQAAAVLAVMFSLEWRLTLISVMIVPLFIFAARCWAHACARLRVNRLEANAQMNAMMNETLNIGGALLVKLFGRKQLEVERFGERASQVRNLGIKRAYTGSDFLRSSGCSAQSARR
jgi:ATP-binding cassette, subfamily B, bacterial